MFGITIGVIIFFLVISLFIKFVESKSGYLGDSSMVPGCLIVMVIILAIIALIGISGHNPN